MLRGLNQTFFEFLNLNLGAASLFGFIVISWYLVAEYLAGRISISSWIQGNARSVHQLAMALGTICLGESVIRAWVWIARFSVVLEIDTSWMAMFDIIPMAGFVACFLGFLCTVRILTPNQWGKNAWLYCVWIILMLNASSIFVRIDPLDWF